MGTRANVREEQGERVQNFYHHFDGYPEGVGHELWRMLHDRVVWDFDAICDELTGGKLAPKGDYRPCDVPVGDIEYDHTVSCDQRRLTYIHLVDNDEVRLI